MYSSLIFKKKKIRIAITVCLLTVPCQKIVFRARQIAAWISDEFQKVMHRSPSSQNRKACRAQN